MTEELAPKSEQRIRAEAIDDDLARMSAHSRNFLVGLVAVLVLIASAGSVFSAFAAYEARATARQATIQTADNHRTGLQNNQILQTLLANSVGHAQTVADLQVLETNLERTLRAAQLKVKLEQFPKPNRTSSP